MKRELVPVHVNGVFVCDTNKKNSGVYWKCGRRWYSFHHRGWSWWFIPNINPLRNVLSKALRYYRLFYPTGLMSHPDPVVIIGKPPEDSC